MAKILLIVDPQNDFISGSLAVNSASMKMQSLTEHLKNNADDYVKVILTADYHPENHSSFSTNGGTWPVHCVQKTNGARFYKPLMDVLSKKNLRDKYAVAYKGLNADKEEYSVFALDEENNITNSAGLTLFNEIRSSLSDVECIEVCGIAGDFCVYNTIKDMLNLIPRDKIKVLEKFCASIDGGEKLSDLCYYHHIDREII